LKLFNQKTYLAIGIIWLFHLSAIIGISIGYKDWFASKTPLNLIIQNGILIAFLPIKSFKSISIYFLLALLGMGVEILGVNSGFPFGTYLYGENLGFKLFGVPILIGLNWALLVFVTASMIPKRWNGSKIVNAIIGATLMLVLDYFMEFSAPALDFWEFTPINPPLSNYVSWFIAAFIMHAILQFKGIKANRIVSSQIYLAQLLFFISLVIIL
jgi:putative membrane protein